MYYYNILHIIFVKMLKKPPEIKPKKANLTKGVECDIISTVRECIILVKK